MKIICEPGIDIFLDCEDVINVSKGEKELLVKDLRVKKYSVYAVKTGYSAMNLVVEVEKDDVGEHDGEKDRHQLGHREELGIEDALAGHFHHAA